MSIFEKIKNKIEAKVSAMSRGEALSLSDKILGFAIASTFLTPVITGIVAGSWAAAGILLGCSVAGGVAGVIAGGMGAPLMMPGILAGAAAGGFLAFGGIGGAIIGALAVTAGIEAPIALLKIEGKFLKKKTHDPVHNTRPKPRNENVMKGAAVAVATAIGVTLGGLCLTSAFTKSAPASNDQTNTAVQPAKPASSPKI